MAERPLVALRSVPDIHGLGVRETVRGPEGIGGLLSDGSAGLSRVGAITTGAPIAVYHDPEFSPMSIDLGVVFPVPAWVRGPVITPAGRSLGPRTVPGGEVAVVLHVGPYETIGDSYRALADWMSEYGYRAGGPPRELFRRLPTDPGVAVTEIRIPVERAGP